jgi:predicted transcriptional regulator
MLELDSLCCLLFELSSDDRLNILLELKKEAASVTKLSKLLDLTTQEASRQVSRLKQAGLLLKDQKGFYRLTSYAELVLKQLDGLNFVSRYKGYFRKHSLAQMPEDLVLRIGDISEATYLSNVSQALYSVERLIKEAQNYIWLISDQISFGVFCELGKALERGTRNRAIQTKSFVYLPSIVRDYFQYYEEHITQIERRSWNTGALEDRLVDQVDLFLFVSEKEAAVAFPLNSGKFDYLTFSGSEKRFHNWCSNTFEYYWSKAQPLESLIKDPCEWLRDNPKALTALRRILEGQEPILTKDMAVGLERMQLTRNGNLTRLGYYAYSHLRSSSLQNT